MANDLERSTERASRATQCEKILALLKSRPEVSLPEILDLRPRISQHSARIFELRKRGFRIVNRREGGKSFFRLVTTPVAPASVRAVTAPPRTEAAEDFLFPPAVYRDPEEQGR